MPAIMSRKLTSFLFILFVFLGPLSSCQRSMPPLPVISVGHAPHDHHAPLYIAAMNPVIFKEQGGVFLREIKPKKEYELVSGNRTVARVLIDSSTGGNELIRRLAEEHFDIVFGGVPAMLKFIDDGYPIQILSPIMAEGAGLVVRRNLPVNNWREFIQYIKKSERPFRVGYKIDISVQNLIFEYALKEEGIAYNLGIDDNSAKVHLVNLHGAKNLIPSLENGLIDGFVVNQPLPAQAEHRNSGKTIAMLSDLPPKGKWTGNPCCALAANKDFVRSNRDATEIFLLLMMRADRYINEHPLASADQIAEWLNIPPDIERISVPTIKFTVELDQTWNKGIDFWIESMISGNILDGKIKDMYLNGNHSRLIYDMDLYRKVRERS